VTLNATEEAPVTFTDEAEALQVACNGAPVQDTLTEPVKPLNGFTCRLKVADCPADTVAEVDPLLTTLTEKSVPVPETEIIWGLPAALSFIDSVPLRIPLAIGVKVKETMQLAPAASSEVVLQVVPDSETAKSPVVVMLFTASARAPVLLRVTTCAALVVVLSWFRKVRLVGETPGTGKGLKTFTFCSAKIAQLVAASPTLSVMH
jgi:hypothetical protein